jgi:hypothetical protein
VVAALMVGFVAIQRVEAACSVFAHWLRQTLEMLEGSHLCIAIRDLR